MSIPTKLSNLVGSRVLPYTDLGMAQVLASGATSTGTPFTTDYGASVVVVSQLASGSGYLTADVAASAEALNLNTPTSGGFTLPVSGTGLQCAIATTTNSKPYFGIAEVCVSNMGFAKLLILALYELSYGEDWFSVADGGFNAVGTTTANDSDGQGAMVLSAY